jgi:fructosamine-3-kinase
MSPPDHRLDDWISERFDRRLIRRTPVGGGCIHHAWRLEFEDGGRLFAKTNHDEALPWLEAEADGLRALAGVPAGMAGAPAALVIPEPLALARVGSQAVLVLPWLDLGRVRRSAAGQGSDPWRSLGAALADLHRASLLTAGPSGARSGEGSGGRFGWHRDNFIGASPQLNGEMSDWGTFFLRRRLEPQLTLLQSRGRRLALADRLIERACDWLAAHHPDPCLVHGDLWSGNAGLLSGGGGALFDPAVHRGDREVDLAMASLFGGFPTSFFTGYQERWPLPHGFARRAPLYNLYHLLNHANLFGGGYHAQVEATIQDLLKNPPFAADGRKGG